MKANQVSGRSAIACFVFFVCLLLMKGGALDAQNINTLISIEQKVPGNIFYEQERKEITIHTAADSVEWDCFDYWSKKIISGKQVVVDNKVILHLAPERLGWFKLLIRAKQNGQSIAVKQTSFAVVADFDLSAVTNSRFIGQVHAWQSAEVLIPVLKKMGVKYVRDAMRWEAVESRRQVYKFSEKQDRFMALLALNHLNPYLVMALYNPLYDKGLAPVSREARLAFANYVKQVLNRYPAINHIEVWNEPDIGTFSKGLNTEDEKTDFYFNLLKTTYEEVHPAFPKVKVVGFVIGDQASGQFLGKIFQKGALNYMNEYSFHSYIPVPESIVLDIDKHKNVIKAFNKGNSIPVNLSETGFSTFTFTEEEQANYLPRRIVTALAQGIQKISIYNLQNKSTVNESEGAFGLIRHPDDTLGAYTPKPAFATHAALTRELTGAEFIKEEAVSPGLIYCYTFKKGTTDIRVMYAPSGTGVNLYTSKAIEVVDIMGNSRAYTPVNGIVSLTLDRNPVYVKGALKAPFVKEYILPATKPVNLTYGFYLGGYTEFPKSQEGVKLPDSIAAVKWQPASKAFGPEGKKSRAIAKPTPEAKATWNAAITIPGNYKIRAYIPADSTLTTKATTKALYAIYTAGNKVNTINVDQSKNQGKWVELGTYALLRGIHNYVVLSDENPAHHLPLRADVIQYQLIY